MPTFNGFKYFTKDETCPYCGERVRLEEDEKADYPKDFGDYWYEFPTCYRDGCTACMPCGRGCECPECEESDG